MKISDNFYLSELVRSSTAQRKGIDNTPSDVHLKNLTESVLKLWQPARELLGVAMLVSSGYRSPKLNKAVGGSSTSAHSYGFAIDFTAPSFGDSRKVANFLAKALKDSGIKYDQIILEFPDSPNSWVHLGYKSPKGLQRGQLLTATKDRYGKTVYTLGLH